MGLIPGLGRLPGEGNGYLLQYSCLNNLMDRGTYTVIVHGVSRARHDSVTEQQIYQLFFCMPLFNLLSHMNFFSNHVQHFQISLKQNQGLSELIVMFGCQSQEAGHPWLGYQLWLHEVLRLPGSWPCSAPSSPTPHPLSLPGYLLHF